MLCLCFVLFISSLHTKGERRHPRKQSVLQSQRTTQKKGKEEEETHNHPSKLNISAQFHNENRFSGLQSNLLGVGVILVKSGVRKTN